MHTTPFPLNENNTRLLYVKPTQLRAGY